VRIPLLFFHYRITRVLQGFEGDGVVAIGWIELCEVLADCGAGHAKGAQGGRESRLEINLQGEAKAEAEKRGSGTLKVTTWDSGKPMKKET
jgi:hypothetical protein